MRFIHAADFHINSPLRGLGRYDGAPVRRGWYWTININIDVALSLELAIEFYETDAGTCPVREFLDALKSSNPDDFAVVLAGLAKLRNRQYHREPLSKALGDGLFELRHVGKLNTRVLWFFVRQHRIIAVHGIRNKGRAIPSRDLTTARERMRDWHKRAQS